MKNFWILPLLMLLVGACSSSSDDEGEEIDNEPNLVGTWDATSLQTTTAFDLNGDGNSSSDVFEELPCFTSSITFEADGSYTATSSDIVFTGSSLSDIVADCDGMLTENGTYVFVNNSLTLDSEEDEPSTADVVLEGDMLTVSQVDPDFGPVTLVLEKR
ncbi:DUF5004 domain-containing protein [Croceivirga lutea]|uniref:DUF5004 domain-containing protein n=1 Tax=Croceivirga lutea TaxID=1775167 RepID=UPI0016395665|nr:DUF5004 domain-containing protein [Croceivirga lutea]